MTAQWTTPARFFADGPRTNSDQPEPSFMREAKDALAVVEKDVADLASAVAAARKVDVSVDKWADKLANDACHPDALGNERAVRVSSDAQAADPLTAEERATLHGDAVGTCFDVMRGTAGGTVCELPLHHVGDHSDGGTWQWPAEKRSTDYDQAEQLYKLPSDKLVMVVLKALVDLRDDYDSANDHRGMSVVDACIVAARAAAVRETAQKRGAE